MFFAMLNVPMNQFNILQPSEKLDFYLRTASRTDYPYAEIDWTCDLFSFGELVQHIKDDFARRYPNQDWKISHLVGLVHECRRFDLDAPTNRRYGSMHDVAGELAEVLTASAPLERPIIILPQNADKLALTSDTAAGVDLLAEGFEQVHSANVSGEISASSLADPEPEVRRGTEPPTGEEFVSSRFKAHNTQPPDYGETTIEQAVKSEPQPQAATILDGTENYQPTPNFASKENVSPQLRSAANFLYTLAGAETTEIYKAPDAASKSKYVCVALLMIMVAAWGSLSSYHFIMFVSPDMGFFGKLAAVMFSLFWGGFILTVEKAIISTVPSVFPEASDSSAAKTAFYVKYVFAIGIRFMFGLAIASLLIVATLTFLFTNEIDGVLLNFQREQLAATSKIIATQPEVKIAENARVSASSALGAAKSLDESAQKALTEASTRRAASCKGYSQARLNFLESAARPLTSAEISQLEAMRRIKPGCVRASEAFNFATKQKTSAANTLNTRIESDADASANLSEVQKSTSSGVLAGNLKKEYELIDARTPSRALVGLYILLTSSGSQVSAFEGSNSALLREYNQLRGKAISWGIVVLAGFFLAIEMIVLVTRLLGSPLVDHMTSARDRNVLRHLKGWLEKQRPGG